MIFRAIRPSIRDKRAEVFTDSRFSDKVFQRGRMDFKITTVQVKSIWSCTYGHS